PLEGLVDREMSTVVRPHRNERTSRSGRLELSGIGEARTCGGWVEDELGARQAVVECRGTLQSRRVVTGEMHDSESAEDAPGVRLRVVAERGKPFPRLSMDGR